MSHNRLLILPENKAGRDFVVGDIHGAFDLLEKALRAVSFDPSKDRLIAVGDLVNRGAHSAECLHYLSQPWFYSIRGNHEEWFLTLYKDGALQRDVRQTGMSWMLDTPTETLDAIRVSFEKLPVAIEIQTAQGNIGFVHGDVPAGMDWETFKQKLHEDDDATAKMAVWSRNRIDTLDTSGIAGALRVFFGHTVVEGGPKELGNCFFIDTGAVFKLNDEQNTRDFYMTLIDIRANAADICNPQPTPEKLVRTATVRPSSPRP